ETKEVVVPPKKRILNVAVLPSQKEYRPGDKATVKVQLTDFFGKPFVGSTVMTVYDRSVEYVSRGSNVPEIKDFFWKWRRHHNPYLESSLAHSLHNILKQGETGMSNLGLFGDSVVEELSKLGKWRQAEGQNALEQAAPGAFGGRGGADRDGLALGDAKDKAASGPPEKEGKNGGFAGGQPNLVQPTIRKNFADTAYWAASLTTNK